MSDASVGGRRASVWQLWKRATAWISSVSIVRVDEAMDRRTRSTRPWRYKIWLMAWLVAIAVYVPLEILIGALVVLVLRLTGIWESLVIYGPIVVLGSLFFYCMVRSWFCPPVPPGPWKVTTEKERQAAQEQAVRSYKLWHWIAGILTAVTLVGRFLLHSR